MKPYTKEGLACADSVQVSAEGRDVDDDKKPNNLESEPSISEAYYLYELAGVLVHTGTADSGHYFSYVKERSDQPGTSPHSDQELGSASATDSKNDKDWLCFNDMHVFPFDPSGLSSACFGGTENVTRCDATGNKFSMVQQKPQNAYLLIYERRLRLPAPVLTNSSSEKPGKKYVSTQSSEAGTSRVETSVPLSVFAKCWDDNEQFSRNKHVFAPEFANFMLEMIAVPGLHSVWRIGESFRDGGKSNVMVALNAQIQTFQLGLNFACNTLVHLSDKGPFHVLLARLTSLAEKFAPCRLWFITQICRGSAWMVKLLLNCTVGLNMYFIRYSYVLLIQTADVRARYAHFIAKCVSLVEEELRSVFVDQPPQASPTSLDPSTKTMKSTAGVRSFALETLASQALLASSNSETCDGGMGSISKGGVIEGESRKQDLEPTIEFIEHESDAYDWDGDYTNSVASAAATEASIDLVKIVLPYYEAAANVLDIPEKNEPEELNFFAVGPSVSAVNPLRKKSLISEAIIVISSLLERVVNHPYRCSQYLSLLLSLVRCSASTRALMLSVSMLERMLVLYLNRQAPCHQIGIADIPTLRVRFSSLLYPDYIHWISLAYFAVLFFLL
jgi:hypothetical protein